MAELIARLEAAAARVPDPPTPEAVSRYAADRAPFIEALACMDTTSLDDGARTDLFGRLSRLLAHDAAVARALARRQQSLVAELFVLRGAKDALSRYRGPAALGRMFRRTA